MALILLGIFSITETQQVVQYRTYHPVTPSSDSGTGRMMLGGLTEAAGLLVGLCGLTLIIVSTWSLIADFPEAWRFHVPLLAGGIALTLCSRALLRQSRVIRIPEELARDSTSPFYLTRIRKTTAQE
ncbi:hypothetical protein [Luteolibacter soli]|uniref:Uncharacterized protein n=1 Tax=Luteolibacter soli TaxID=3135280 RepID=A0ABU9ANQ3_9BACT